MQEPKPGRSVGPPAAASPLRRLEPAPYHDVYMDLTKKTTILLTPVLYERLMEEAQRRHVSMGELVRDACEIQYGFGASEARVRAVDALAALELPVGTPRQMKRESVVDPDDLLP
jgi:hypothetical protein